MKKGRIIALALAVGITAMGAGYASWTDSVTIKSTVNTGKLELGIGTVTTTYLDSRGSAVINGDVLELKNDAGTEVISSFAKKADADSVELTISNMYPTATGTAIIPITNTSTIPVKFDMAEGQTEIVLPNYQDDDFALTARLSSNTLGNIDFGKVENLDALKAELGKIELPAGETMTMTININLSQNDTDFQSKLVSFKFKPVFKQFNQ